MSREKPGKTVERYPDGSVKKITWTDEGCEGYKTLFCPGPREQEGNWFCPQLDCDICYNRRPRNVQKRLDAEQRKAQAEEREKQMKAAAELLAKEKLKATEAGKEILCLVFDPETGKMLNQVNCSLCRKPILVPLSYGGSISDVECKECQAVMQETEEEYADRRNLRRYRGHPGSDSE